MNDWVYRVIMAVLVINILFGVYAVATYQAPPKHCLAGIVMVLDKDKDMYVQQGLWPTHCMPIDRD
jgi:hypothetical protein